MPLPALEFVALEGDLAPIVGGLPTGARVAQLLGPGGRSLMLAQASNLKKWAASHLGLGDPPPPGRRPKTNLAGIATRFGWARTGSPFGQRLLYERLIAPLIPVAERRDLKPPAFLRLDPGERFPRVTVRDAEEEVAGRFGPFRSRRAAEKARDTVNRLFALRPCDFAFEPDPALPLGLGCLYAQVSSCAAPCLARLAEGDYRAIAARAAAWLAEPSARPDAPPEVPAVVGAVAGARAVVVGVGCREVELYPVREGRVLEAAATSTPAAGIEEALARTEWPASEGPADWPWLAAWLTSPRGRGSYFVVRDLDDRNGLAEAIRSVLPQRFARPPGGDNVEASKGEE